MQKKLSGLIVFLLIMVIISISSPGLAVNQPCDHTQKTEKKLNNAIRRILIHPGSRRHAASKDRPRYRAGGLFQTCILQPASSVPAYAGTGFLEILNVDRPYSKKDQFFIKYK